MAPRHLLLLLAAVSCLYFVTASPKPYIRERPAQISLQGAVAKGTSNSDTIPQLLEALDVLNKEYFEIWQGIWPTSIDWTSAVIGTYLAASLNTISSSSQSLPANKTTENTVNKYFSQLTSSYFGQNIFALRQEAYDDMLWVVLGWLEGIKFIEVHSARHYTNEKNETVWHGTQFIPAFAHRARIFWELAAKGWDTKLCNGGMIWSPYLTPYKNAITNELFISASISMYLYFPGDDNASPFGVSTEPQLPSLAMGAPKDRKYLDAAIEAYDWLMDSNMTDANGLFVDGYHISGGSHSPNTRCDERNEMVYTYNEGVVLSGQRGLYEATGHKRYLKDGHKLISNVISATGWDLQRDHTLQENVPAGQETLGEWYGLGRSGILEEACDAGAYCSQDAQTFKGIFFHHFTTFCKALPEHLDALGTHHSPERSPGAAAKIKKWHTRKCQSYQGWIKHNAQAAFKTKDSDGKYGMWWGAPENSQHISDPVENVLPQNAVDYRNHGIPADWVAQSPANHSRVFDGVKESARSIQARDLNDRGRGRTVETQGGGISLLVALQELVD